MAGFDYDVLIIGSGLDGSVAALRAAETAESKHDRSEKRGCLHATSNPSTSRRNQWVRPRDERC